MLKASAHNCWRFSYCVAPAALHLPDACSVLNACIHLCACTCVGCVHARVPAFVSVRMHIAVSVRAAVLRAHVRNVHFVSSFSCSFPCPPNTFHTRLQHPTEAAGLRPILNLMRCRVHYTSCTSNRRSWGGWGRRAAVGHSDDMASNNFFSHTGSNGSTLGSRAADAGFDSFPLGENIAAGFQSVRAVVLAWMWYVLVHANVVKQ